MRTSTGVLVLAVAVVGAGMAGGGPAAASAARPEAVKETRDPLLWPFARTSIWNTPIGARARYVPARIRSTGFGVDVNWFVVTRKSDPAVPVYMPATSGEGRCAGTGAQQQEPWHPQARRKQHLRRSFLLPDAIPHGG